MDQRQKSKSKIGCILNCIKWKLEYKSYGMLLRQYLEENL